MRSHRAEVSAASGCAKALLLGALLVGLTFIRERFFVVRERFKVTTDPAGPGRRIVDRPYDGRGDRSTAEPGWFDAGDHGGPRSAPGHLVPDPRRARTAGTSAPRARSRRGREPVAVERRARHHGHTTATTRSHSARLTRPTRPRPMQQSHPTHRWRAGWRSPLRPVPAAGVCALRWCDIDLVNATARIERSVCATRSAGVVIKTTQTDRPRLVSLTQRAVNVLARRYETLTAGDHAVDREGLVFSTHTT